VKKKINNEFKPFLIFNNEIRTGLTTLKEPLVGADCHGLTYYYYCTANYCIEKSR